MEAQHRAEAAGDLGPKFVGVQRIDREVFSGFGFEFLPEPVDLAVCATAGQASAAITMVRRMREFFTVFSEVRDNGKNNINAFAGKSGNPLLPFG